MLFYTINANNMINSSKNRPRREIRSGSAVTMLMRAIRLLWLLKL